jgi:hypothetical protein
VYHAPQLGPRPPKFRSIWSPGRELCREGTLSTGRLAVEDSTNLSRTPVSCHVMPWPRTITLVNSKREIRMTRCRRGR